jgi:hypothetical protein
MKSRLFPLTLALRTMVVAAAENYQRCFTPDGSGTEGEQ